MPLTALQNKKYSKLKLCYLFTGNKVKVLLRLRTQSPISIPGGKMKSILFLGLIVCSLPSFADIVCRFDPTDNVSSIITYNQANKTVTVEYGFPLKRDFYTNITEVKNSDQSLALKFSGDVSIVTIDNVRNHDLWYDFFLQCDPFEAHWGKLPGGPENIKLLGACRMQDPEVNSSNQCIGLP